jgi:DNA repair protein RadC
MLGERTCRRLILNKTSTVKDLPLERRPYEKCLKFGPAALTNSELLAIIIRTGSKGVQSIELADRILNYKNNETGLLNILHLNINQLMEIKGIGLAKATQIQCIAELSKRISKTSAHKQLIFTHPSTIADYYMEELRHCDREKLLLLLLNTRSVLIKDIMLSHGTVNAALISPREIFVEALKYSAVYIILLHNHPSGNPNPSRDDILNTKRVKEAGDLIGITLIDHVIIGDNNYVSLKERGIL